MSHICYQTATELAFDDVEASYCVMMLCAYALCTHGCKFFFLANMQGICKGKHTLHLTLKLRMWNIDIHINKLFDAKVGIVYHNTIAFISRMWMSLLVLASIDAVVALTGAYTDINRRIFSIRFGKIF